MVAEPVFSFCIRSLHPDVTEENIRDALKNIAHISSIDFVNKNTRPMYTYAQNCFKMAFIHVECWVWGFENYVDDYIMKVREPEGLRVYYNDTYYFVLRENLSPPIKRESRVALLERENADLYKEIFRLKQQLGEIVPTATPVKYPNPDAKIPLKKRLKNKKSKIVEKKKELDKDLEDYLYITTDDEDNNIHMNVTLTDEV